MNQKPLISICIPTYNRSHYLKECLDTIVLQFDNETVKNSVQVIISDDASSDNTKELAESYQARFNNITYFKNKENLGMDGNIANSVLKANGKYCWHIGDDDIIQNGALDLIIKILTKKEVALLTVNFYPFIDIKKASERKVFGNDYAVEYIYSAEEFCDKCYSQGFLGIFIFNKELWLNIDKKNYEKFWSWLEFIFKMIGTTRLPLAHLKTPVLFIGQDYRWNENGGALFCTIHIKRVFDKLQEFGYSKNFVNNNINILSKSLPRALLTAKSYDLKWSFDNLFFIYKEFYRYPIQLFLTTLIFFIPNYFLKIAKKIKKI